MLGIYKHHKGLEYEVIGVANHSGSIAIANLMRHFC